MAPTLPSVRLLTAALVLFTASAISAQTLNGEVPVRLLAPAAAVDHLYADARGVTKAADDAPVPAMTWESVAAPFRSPLVPTFNVDVEDRQSRGLALPMLYASLGALQGLDLYTTQKGVALGADETNGLVRKGNRGTTMALKAASTAATIFIAERMWKKNKAGALALMVATNVVFGAVVANNQRVIGQLQ